jgi:hypothetical protein
VRSGAILIALLVGLLAALLARPVSAAAPRTPAPAPATLNQGTGVPAAALSGSGADHCARVAYLAGFSSTAYPDGAHRSIVIAVAVALAESSCNRNATNTNGPTSGCPNGSTDQGLWQINNCYHSGYGANCVFNEQCNAIAAYQISSRGTNWTPWATYQSGVYLNYISTAQGAIANLTVVLHNRGDGTCLAGDGSASGNGAPIFQWACDDNNPYEQWHVMDVNGNGDLLVLKNVGDGTCLAGDGSARGNGAPIFQWTCEPANIYEQWQLGASDVASSNANATLYNNGDGTCLAGDGSASGNAAPIFQWSCIAGNVYEQWR